MKDKLKKSIERAKNWNKDGWMVTFGPGQVEVASIQQAMDLPKEAPNRQEAIAYWNNVQVISIEVTKYLEGALADLEKGDMKALGNKLYAAQYHEKPLEQYTNTSGPLYKEFLKI